MANKFHRLLTDAELHRPERAGEGDPNQQSLPSLEDGQYYQDTLTGSVWRYREDQANVDASTWELLLDYDKDTGLLANARQKYNVSTSQVGELKSAIKAKDSISTLDLNLYTQVREGEEIEIIDREDTSNTVTFTVSATSDGGNSTVSVQTQRPEYSFAVGSPVFLDSALFGAYQSADPTKILQSITQERDARVLGTLDSPLVASGEYSNISVARPSMDINTVVRDEQYLRLYDVRGEGQFVRVNGDQTLSNSSVSIIVDTFTAQNDYIAGDSYLEEPSWQSSTQISQTANTVSILSGTVSNLGTSVASINTRTGTLESNVIALASVDTSQNTAISTAQLTATNAYAAANLAVRYDNSGAYVKLIAGTTGSEITLQANNINISGLITAINGEGGVDANATQTISANAEPNLRPSGANLEVGDIWIDTDDGNKPYVWQNIAGTEDWIAAYTAINGGDITTGSINASLITTGTLNVTQVVSANAITTRELNVANLFAQSIDVGNVIKSSNFDANNGFAIYSNGNAIFREVEVDGKIITDTGSSIDGTYVSNINAGNITVGSIDANVIAVNNINASQIVTGTLNVSGLLESNSITSDKINVDNLFAQDITIQSGGSISGTNFTLNDTGGNIAGWIIAENTLKSSNTGARVELNKGKNRVSIFDANGEKAVVGYLDGVPKNDSTGNWASSDYGFWAKNGDRLIIDGDVEYESGDWMIQNDASYKVLDGSATPKEIIRLGTESGQKGLFLYNNDTTTSSNTDSNIAYTTGNVVAKFISTGFYVGDNSSVNYIEYDQSTGELSVRGSLNASDIVTGTLEANRIDVNVQLNASQIVTGTLNVAGLVEANAIEASKINVTDLFAQSASINGSLTVSGGNISFDGGKITSNGLQLEVQDYVGDGSSINWSENTHIHASEIFGAPAGSTEQMFLYSRTKTWIIAGTASPSPTLLVTNESGVQDSPGVIIDNADLYAKDNATIDGDLTVGGNVQASYKSDDGTAGISDTITFFDSQATLTNNVTIKNGIITSWTQS